MMEFCDLKKQYLSMKEEMDEAILSAVAQTHFIGGPQVEQLEKELASYVGEPYCISCSTGTDALNLAMRAIGCGPGDAVFTTAFSFFATAEVVALNGATPVFADINPDTFNLDPVSLEQAIQKVKKEGLLRPKAVITVDLFGQPADYPAIRNITNRENLVLIEDAAQGFGGQIDGKLACSFGDISATSFFPSKPLGCYGDGGAIFTDNQEYASVMSSLKVHGKGADKYDNLRIGYNSRLDTVQAAVLLTKFSRFEWEVERRNQLADCYTKALSGIVKTPVVPKGYRSSWAQYTLMLPQEANRPAIQKALLEFGVKTMVYYPKPLHLQSAFLSLGYEKGSLPYAEAAADRVLSLPMHPYWEQSEVAQVCKAVQQVLG